MSTPPAPESKPSPWLTMAVPIVVTLLGMAAQWGTLGAEVRSLERRASTTESELARVNVAQTNAREQAARIEAQLDAMNRELARLARAIEKLADSPRASR
ncbi:hypothetical protein [Archangium minus]